jgi:glycosyltransferase involved in cell wall biosynthesis
MRRASRIFAVSERLREFAITLGADPDKVKTIPNGIDTAIFFPRDRHACRIAHGFALDRLLIVSAGALVERKGHHRIISVLQVLITAGLEADLVIAGGPGPEGDYEKTLRQLVSSLALERSVRFLGPVTSETMAEVMSAADLFCLASSNEGWPNVVHEALACGTPVVATDVGAVPEMLAGGRNGLVVPLDDSAALRNAIEFALQKEWDRSAISGWGQARSWEHVAVDVLEQMRDIVAEEEEVAQ